MPERLGAVLRRARNRANLNQTQVAQELDYMLDPDRSRDQTRVSAWERGASLPPIDILDALAQIYNASLLDLLAEAGFTTSTPDVEMALLADPSIDDNMRSSLIEIYRSVRSGGSGNGGSSSQG